MARCCAPTRGTTSGANTSARNDPAIRKYKYIYYLSIFVKIFFLNFSMDPVEYFVDNGVAGVRCLVFTRCEEERPFCPVAAMEDRRRCWWWDCNYSPTSPAPRAPSSPTPHGEIVPHRGEVDKANGWRTAFIVCGSLFGVILLVSIKNK